ncbi:unnamed protein product [Caenorhabditis auriculariae]|uniref:Fungal lipase-type domain-containing protein n=1 Tax=Caenorhabditis auriculariae TaxID=2777116 RepID=A0A8S1GYT8_9PELO|nr:unnamed protein product [Caenorhabditis auriculariae]
MNHAIRYKGLADKELGILVTRGAMLRSWSACLLLLAAAVPTSAQYSDAFVRKFFPTLFAATESSNASSCLSKIFTDFEMKKMVTVDCDKADGLDHCRGYTAVSHDQKVITLNFRGTKGKLQLLVESDQTITQQKVSWVGGGAASSYFANAFLLIWNNGMKDDFLNLVHKFPDYDVWIGGHSLGGAMAALASSYVTGMNLVSASKIKLVTFGQPRTGDVDFANAHDSIIPYTYRVVHKNDIVPHLPPRGLENFRHHKSEVWYNNDMTKVDFKECDSQESPLCSDLHVDASIEDHHRYFNMYMTYYGLRDCTGDPSSSK